MNYKKVYDKLITKVHHFNKGDYSEEHHIIPKSIGGTDDKSNLVRLTAREHYIAHLLLVKIYQSNIDAYGKMLYAFNCMRWGRVNGNRSFRFNSRLYQSMKEQYSQVRKSMMKVIGHNPSMGKIWIHSVELRQSKLWDKVNSIPNGWKIGRVVNWNSYSSRIDKSVQIKIRKERVSHIKKDRMEKAKQLYTKMYSVYCEFGFDEIKKRFDYKFSQVNFVKQCKRYVDDYKPQMGKKRGIR